MPGRITWQAEVGIPESDPLTGHSRGLPMTTDFNALIDTALAVAGVAAAAENAKLGPEASRGFDCGFAWVIVPKRTEIAKALAARNLINPMGRELTIWYSHIHSEATQSVSVHQAAVRAFVESLTNAGVTGLSCGSRLD